MKKVETRFICDDCGKVLPNKFVKTNDKKEQFFNNRDYNTVTFPINADCCINIHVDLEVSIDYGATYRELCPECRVKWLKKALIQFEEELKNDDSIDWWKRSVQF